MAGFYYFVLSIPRQIRRGQLATVYVCIIRSKPDKSIQHLLIGSGDRSQSRGRTFYLAVSGGKIYREIFCRDQKLGSFATTNRRIVVSADIWPR